MITENEIIYIAAPVLFLGLVIAFFLLSRAKVRLGLLIAGLIIIPLWVRSVHALSNLNHQLSDVWHSQEADLIKKCGQPSKIVSMSEGDRYLLYRIRVAPWSVIAIYNVYRGKVISSTRAEDFSAALDTINTRSAKEASLVVSNLRALDRQANGAAPIVVSPSPETSPPRQ